MNDESKSNSSVEPCETDNNPEEGHDELRREFMKRFGGYAAAAPLGLYAAMKPGKSLAASEGM